ncbi:uncharacterized protein N7482_007131 [Penicillium canariense]|uniref:SRR1-like domain-containing protein n=1 Tax=Penicillium canariense TaxID=189055 RepID=A0A9W9LIT9_9EURO|nr:uncharacterized protein N7482_007131 [Penicillium canariense]KAJ5160127.1 hypothetical protein N7482_007131 [Penicillium canariense]
MASDGPANYQIHTVDVNTSNDYFGGSFRWSEAPPYKPQTMEEAQGHIDYLYESGVPFFSKEMIRAVFEQCQRKPARGELIYVKGVDGATVEFVSKTGEIKKRTSADGVSLEYLLLDPVISYDCRAHLKHRLWWTGLPGRPPFCSLTIQHPSLEFKAGSNEPVVHWPTQPREEVAQAFQGHFQDWQETEVCQQLKQVLHRHAATHRITKVVGLALSAMSIRVDDCPRSYIQHALLLTLRNWLAERDGTEVTCYAQDPGYRSVDKEVLRAHNIQVIDDPQAWLEIDDQSVVFSVAPNVPVKEIVADIARPGIIIWERVGFEDADQEGKTSSTDPSSPRVRAMLEGYELFDFGAEDDPNFCRTVMYIRRHQG